MKCLAPSHNEVLGGPITENNLVVYLAWMKPLTDMAANKRIYTFPLKTGPGPLHLFLLYRLLVISTTGQS